MLKSRNYQDNAVSRTNTPVKLDTTTYLLSKQLEALSCAKFELGIKSEKTGQMWRRIQTSSQILQKVGWLKFKNVQHNHIYLRLGPGEAVVLIDDINMANLLNMDRDGIAACCVIETSPLNYQAWIRIGEKFNDPNVATCLGEFLAENYGGDLSSKDFRHLGRAVGFTNVKESHRMESGLFPYTKLIESTGVRLRNSHTLLGKAAARSIEKRRERQRRHESLSNLPSRSRSPRGDSEQAYTRALNNIVQKYGDKTDMSRADASVVLHLLHQGYSVTDIERVMLASEDIGQRKKGHIEDYVSRTIRWAVGAVREKQG